MNYMSKDLAGPVMCVWMNSVELLLNLNYIVSACILHMYHFNLYFKEYSHLNILFMIEGKFISLQ